MPTNNNSAVAGFTNPSLVNNPVGYLNTINKTGVSVSPNTVSNEIRPNINLKTPTTAMSLADIVREPDANKRNSLLENYYDESLKASGVNNVLQPGLNPYRPLPALNEVVSKNLPSYTNPITGTQTSLTNYTNPIAGYISAPGGSPIGVGANELFGLDQQGNYIGGGIPGFDTTFNNGQPSGFNIPDILKIFYGAGMNPFFNLQPGGQYNFNPLQTLLVSGGFGGDIFNNFQSNDQPGGFSGNNSFNLDALINSLFQ